MGEARLPRLAFALRTQACHGALPQLDLQPVQLHLGEWSDVGRGFVVGEFAAAISLGRGLLQLSLHTLGSECTPCAFAHGHACTHARTHAHNVDLRRART